TCTKYVVPATAWNVTLDCGVLFASSLHATCVRLLSPPPVYMTSVVSKLLPNVFTFTDVALLDVKPYQTVLPIGTFIPTQLTFVGSPGSVVALLVFSVNCAGRVVTGVALAKLSFAGGGVVAVKLTTRLPPPPAKPPACTW